MKTVLTLLALLSGSPAPAQEAPRIVLRPAAPITLPGQVDSNSPAHRSSDGRLVVFTSNQWPARSVGRDLLTLGEPAYWLPIDGDYMARWIEATWKDDEGTLYAWYHNEPLGLCPTSLTVPRIGAMRSFDDGANWEDLGIVLEAPGPIRCDSANPSFAGGNGDFVVLPDGDREYFYFYFTSYGGTPLQQGIGAARMRYQDRDAPAGKVWKWKDGAWDQRGRGGDLSPVIGVAGDWMRGFPTGSWGPSIHWNRHLQQYVMLLNGTLEGQEAWRQDGTYASFNPYLSDPEGWSRPVKVFDGADVPPEHTGYLYYPEIIGLGEDDGDKRADATARLFLGGTSYWEAHFLRPEEADLDAAD